MILRCFPRRLCSNAMCKCCQSCFETIWWHAVEKRFCYDESIALYEEPEKQEKNNNMFENIAFYDSVSVIAGRAVVTIDPIPRKPSVPIIEQPKRPVEEPWRDRTKSLERSMSKSAPEIVKTPTEDSIKVPFDISSDGSEDFQPATPLSATQSDVDVTKKWKNSLDTVHSAGDLTENIADTHLSVPVGQFRKMSLFERRKSRSLAVKIECIGDQCREVPIIRQNSMPKFFLGSPEDHQIETSVFRTPSTALASPVPPTTKQGFVFDLSSIVQIENERALNSLNLPQVHDRKKRPIADKMVKLRRIRSTMSAFQTHHM